MSGPMLIPFWRRPLQRSHTGGSSENEGSAGSRVNIHQKLQEKKQKQLAELKIIEEEIKQGKLGGPVASTLDSGDDCGSLMRQPIPRTKKHVEPIEWRPPTPSDGGDAGDSGSVGTKVYNDLNVLSSSNLDEVNNLNKYSSTYDPLYNSFGMNSINIPTLAKDNFASLEQTTRNMSPSISSQVSATESNSLTRKVMPRQKILPRNPFAENYRGNYTNIYADSACNNNSNGRAPSISPRNTANSPNRGNASNNPGTSAGATATNTATHYEHHGVAAGLYVPNHPRQISGTYSSCIENSGVENLPFPYSVIPPPRSKLDSRHTPTAPKGTFIQRQLVQRQMQRAKTPEILLAPHYLDNTRIYYDWVTREPVYRDINDRHRVSSGDENLDEQDSVLDSGNPNRVPSDIDSQVRFILNKKKTLVHLLKILNTCFAGVTS